MPGEYVQIAVSDTGVGMSPAVQERLFEPFFTTKGVGEGTGLGLATSYGIVTQCGGHIEVYSEPGSGTTMRVYLPRVVDAQAIASEASPVPRGASSDTTVLVVEDEPGVRRIATLVLQRHGYRVLEASNGVDALRLLDASTHTIDLVISDMVMPELGGRELAERIEKKHSGMKMLFMSGYTEDFVARNRTLGRTIPLLQKPFTANDLARAVHSVLSGEVLAVAPEPATVVA
jgi:CheY-like chemotaxis protein